MFAKHQLPETSGRPLASTPSRRGPFRSLAVLGTLMAVLFLATAVNAAPGDRKATTAPSAEGVVNINTAPVEQLVWLPNIGPSRAERIVSYRARHPFKRVVHLARVKGIGLKTVRNLKPYVTLKGATTATGPLGRKQARGPKKPRS